MIKDIIQNVYSKHPLVHNITNYVAATDCANITLTIGASPIMAEEPKEVGEVTQISDGLVLNCGTISESRLNSMLISGKTAKSREIPIVLDPVGVGISKFRTSAVHKIITEVKPDIIRLNASELKSICLNIKNMSGVDAVNIDSLDDTVELAKKLSLKTNAIIGVSGISDIVTDGKNTAVISGGHAMMKKITGSGCMLSSVIGAFAAANPNIDKKTLRLYAVTDRTWLDGRTLYDDVEKALKGGVTLLQLREKNMSTDDFINSAKEIKSLCEKYNVPLIINDNVDVAKAVNADGVHIGQNDMPTHEARKILGKNKIIGVTAKTVEQAQKAEKDGADYLGSGAIFGTTTKGDAKKMDMQTLKSITSSVNIPVVAIGGIDGDNVLQLKGTGIVGAAVVSGIFAQDDIETATKDLYNKIGEII